MPIINGYEYTAEQAIAADYCPECGADFRKVNPHAHRLEHWRHPAPAESQHDETRKRIALYDKYLETHAPLSSSGEPPKLRIGARLAVTLDQGSAQ